MKCLQKILMTSYLRLYISYFMNIVSHCIKSAPIWSFLVCILPNSYWIWRDKPYLSVFTPSAGKYGSQELRIRTIFVPWLGQRLLKKPVTPVSCLIKLKRMMRKLIFCFKLVNLLIFRNKKLNFYAKNIAFWISVAAD